MYGKNTEIDKRKGLLCAHMPNISEIAKFKDELKDVAHENKITAGWGEPVYDELPLPDTTEVPDIDLDALLPENESPRVEPASAEQEPAAIETASTMFDSVPVTGAPTDTLDTLFPADAESGSSDALAHAGTSAEQTTQDASAAEMGLGEAGSEPDIVQGDAYPVDDTAAPEPSDFDDFLSSLNFDTLSTDDAASSGTAQPADSELPDRESGDTPPINLDDMDFGTMDFSGIDSDIFNEPEASGFEGSADPLDTVELDAPASGSDDPFNFDDMLSSFDFAADRSGAEEKVEDAIIGDENAELPSEGQKASSDVLATDKLEPFEPPESGRSAGSSEPSADGDDFGGLDGFDNLDNLEELSLFSEHRAEPHDAAQDVQAAELPAGEHEAALSDQAMDSSQDVSEAQPLDINPVLDADIAALAAAEDIPDPLVPAQGGDAWEQAGFSLEENPLESDITEIVDDQFNLPDNFKDFSADTQTRMFDSVIAKSTGSTENPDRLTISDDDYFAFLNKLESFPLNVQLAIQNYIANGDDSPENKMDFIRFVLGKASLKKIVNKLEKILKISIPIPRGFQRRSVEEHERELHSFKYWFMHRCLPVAVMSAIALILIFCISVLSWQFIYKPVTAESLYRAGYAHLENGRYEPAIDKFNQAGEYYRKKSWYFAYARAFREKKQYTAAEWMYSKILYDFNNDKQGGVEYADMLSTDLRNYEKAETVLRRRVLDYHANDKDGLLALGDVFTNWADEDPEKYTDAVKIYSRLIELYGENDVFLLRMMKYFIRTDNLAEVLKLKYHFGSRITRIEPASLTELSGYLLEKRYKPKPLDSEKLRAQIDDVRMLLEKAVQSDKSMPEAYYNLGRFFIYNNKQDGAIENLAKSISLFKTMSSMPARRLLRSVDAMRLLGEQLASQKKYLDAQALYADAISTYRNYTAFKPLPPHRDIGRLYADYGDIDYFISHNFDSALESYQRALKEKYDTPSLHYRIGYIHYSQEDYQQAIASMSRAAAEKAHDKNLLYGFGNAFFKRGDYFAAVAAYEELFALLNAQRSRKERALSNTRPDDAAFMEKYMHTANNLGASLSRLSARTGDSKKNARALALYAEASRAWDALTRNPQTMIRAKSVGLAYLNTKNMLNANSSYESEIYTDIPMILENEKDLEQKEDK